MVSKWVITPIFPNPLTNHLLTSWDIQVGDLQGPHPLSGSRCRVFPMFHGPFIQRRLLRRIWPIQSFLRVRAEESTLCRHRNCFFLHEKWVFYHCHPYEKITPPKIVHHILKMYFLLKMGNFQCHVSFQGCTPPKFNHCHPFKNGCLGFQGYLKWWALENVHPQSWTARPWKMGGWKTILSYWESNFWVANC